MTLKSGNFKVLATAALAVVALSTAPAMAGPGKSGDHGGGNKGGNHGQSNAGGQGQGQLVKASNQGGQKGQSQRNGTLASELKKINGAIHASFRAWTKASSNGVPGQARTYAESREALSTYDSLALETEAMFLSGDLSLEEYNAKIDERIAALDDTSEDYDAEVARLTDLKYSELPDGTQTALRLEEINTELTTYESGEDALNSLTGGRELSEEAMGVFEARVDEYLASDEYLATVENEEVLLVEEEVPVE
jgi:hypothetical protein